MSNKGTAQRERLLRIGKVLDASGMSRSSLYASPLSKARVRITTRCVAWPESAIQRFIEERMAEGLAVA